VPHRSDDLKKLLKARLSSRESSGLYLTLLLLLLLIATWVFGAIAEDVVTRDPLTIIDARFSVWLHGHTLPWLTASMSLITRVHSLFGVIVMTLAVGAYLWTRRLRVWVLRLMLAVFGGMLLNLLLKYVFMRPRPQLADPLLALTTYSFPSGHTLAATVFYGTLCALVVSRAHRWRWRLLGIAGPGLIILLVGFSRIYLGAHYLSDVLAAIAEGLAWLAFCFVAIGEWSRRHNVKHEK
jgi:membrane-associated phospholipid phosphatase